MPANPAYDEAWKAYFADHPEVLANWNHQNGSPPPQGYEHLYRLDTDPQGNLGTWDDDEEEYRCG